MIHIEHFTFNAFQTRCSVVWGDTSVCAIVDPGCSSEAELSQLVSFISGRGLKPACILLTHAHFDHIYGVSALVSLYGRDLPGGLPVYMHPEESYTLENTNPYVCKAYGLPLPDTSFASVGDASAKAAAECSAAGTAGGSAAMPTDNGAVVPAADSAVVPAGDGAVVPTVDGAVIEVGTLRFEVIFTPGHSRGGVCYYEPAERVLFSGDTLFAGAIGRTDHPGGDYDQLMNSILTRLLPLDDAPAANSRHTSVMVIPGHGPCSDLATEGMTNPFLLPFNEPYDD